MTALELHEPEKFDFEAFSSYLQKELPTYALPRFLRLLPEIETTSTFKLLKSQLVNEGFDISVIKDDILYLDLETLKYKELDFAAFNKIVTGASRL